MMSSGLDLMLEMAEEVRRLRVEVCSLRDELSCLRAEDERLDKVFRGLVASFNHLGADVRRFMTKTKQRFYMVSRVVHKVEMVATPDCVETIVEWNENCPFPANPRSRQGVLLEGFDTGLYSVKR